MPVTTSNLSGSGSYTYGILEKLINVKPVEIFNTGNKYRAINLSKWQGGQIIEINLRTLCARDRDFPSAWWKSTGSIASPRNISRRYHLNQQDLSRQKFNLISTLSPTCSHFLPLFVSLLARPHIISQAAGFRTLIRHRAQDQPNFSSYSILHDDGFTLIAIFRI